MVIVNCLLDLLRGERFLLAWPLMVAAYFWGRDIVREGAYLGAHISSVSKAILIAMQLFIFSEVIFFLGFFASHFYSMFSGETCCGMTFPASKVEVLDPYGIPLLNTALLLSSGVTVTWGHGGLSGRDSKTLGNGLLLSGLLRIVFLACQFLEYYNCPFTMSSRIYGSNFFALTRFHGFHVFVGIIGLFVCWGRSLINTNYFRKRVGCDCFIWY